jgi:SH3-like domain-containing protein
MFLVVLGFVLFAANASAKRVSVDVSYSNVRTGPGNNYEVAWEKVDRYYPLEVMEQADKWYYVKDYEGDTGWIYSGNVSEADSVITKKDKCNVREKPMVKSRIVFVVDNGVPFRVVQRKGNWIEIKHADGDKGWIHNSLVW